MTSVFKMGCVFPIVSLRCCIDTVDDVDEVDEADEVDDGTNKASDELFFFIRFGGLKAPIATSCLSRRTLALVRTRRLVSLEMVSRDQF